MQIRHLPFLIVSLNKFAYGAIYQSFDELPSGKPYDFVVAGGGTAGSVIANRLTENPKFRVLVLEAGPSNEGIIELEAPGLASSLWYTTSPFDWNYTTVPQVGLNGRSVIYNRGYVLGGSSSINGMAYTRGSADDYDRWAAATGDEGWNWKNMLPYIWKNEHFVLPGDGHSIDGQFNPKYHSFTGINFVTVTGYARPFDNVYLQASKELENEFPFDLDMNDGTPLGLCWKQATIVNGTRSSAATSYLGPRFINRHNLDVVLNTRVSRVLKSSHHKSINLRTIEFMSANRTLHTITAQKEVILSLGSIGTPHILLNSGIGDKEDLKKVGVKSVLNLHSVGKNLSDHLYIMEPPITWSINMTFSPGNATADLNQWIENRTGPLSFGYTNQYVWGRVHDKSSIFNATTQDPAAGSHTPHYEFILYGSPNISPTGEAILSMTVAVVTITSRGYISIKSNNPFDKPLIDPAYLTEDTDVLLFKEAISSAKRFIGAPVFKDLMLRPQGEFENVTDDQTLEQFIRNNVGQGFHIVGTASMSPRGAQYGVVDPDLLLKGAAGLRIVDASVMPYVPSGHTQAPTYAIAERAADLIKHAWL
ncbi:pyranose dehydrogenase [Cyathus striatus]|nr:pyranose dehydrogenase [Cyathus striatus]